jgi:hypothetical protein
LSRLRNDTSKKAISLMEFDCFAGAKPRLQLASVSKLAEVDLRHRVNVSHYVAHVKFVFGSAPTLKTPTADPVWFEVSFLILAFVYSHL